MSFDHDYCSYYMMKQQNQEKVIQAAHTQTCKMIKSRKPVKVYHITISCTCLRILGSGLTRAGEKLLKYQERIAIKGTRQMRVSRNS